MQRHSRTILRCWRSIKVYLGLFKDVLMLLSC